MIAYRELRKLELEILRAVHEGPGSRFLNIHQEIQIDVDQFYGIEIEEFPAQIAQVALWLVDHQMNMRISEEFGLYFARIPLVTTPHIVHGNALRVDWNDVLPAERCSFLMGNPPFVGAMVMSDGQREDFALVFRDLKGCGILDYVSAWYWKAAAYVHGTSMSCAFVSTNSITQGEQVGILWAVLMTRFAIHIRFAHRTFRWSNEAKGTAAVHCVIIGFCRGEPRNRTIFEYESIDGAPHAVPATNINAYLIDGPSVFLLNRDTPICRVPEMAFGNMPRDGGHLLLDDTEKIELLQAEPKAANLVRPFISAKEFLNAERRWCLWLTNVKPQELRAMPTVIRRIDEVRKFRLASPAASTRKFAQTPTLFCQIAQPGTDYLLIPRHSSENRTFIPMGFFKRENIVADSCLFIGSATHFHFGVMSSTMHNAWVRYTCGRLESRYRYSKDIVYNNFPWPEAPTDKQREAIEAAAQGVLDARAQFPDASLADLYDPLTTPPALVKAHQKLDATVDAAYGRKGFKNDAERVAFLFELYEKYTSLLPSAPKPKRRRRTR